MGFPLYFFISGVFGVFIFIFISRVTVLQKGWFGWLVEGRRQRRAVKGKGEGGRGKEGDLCIE